MSRFFGNKAFYKMVFTVAVPIMIQNGITNFVALLDNVMLGRVGTEQMSGAAIVNQLLFVFNLCVFGGISGAGIFSAQFFGQDNHKGVRETFRFKLITVGLISAASIALFVFFGTPLISSYLYDADGVGNIALALGFGEDYLKIMLIGLVPFAVTQAYAGTLRETNKTTVPMVAGMIAVSVNLILNYILIFGKLGFKPLGVEGAAIATVISRFIECAVVVSWTHANGKINHFIVGAYKGFSIPRSLAAKIIVTGFPLMLNETLWAGGMAKLNQCYSFRGIGVVAATNIATTVSNLFSIVFMALGVSVGIIIGQLLGAGKLEEAQETDVKLITFSVLCSIAVGAVMAACSPFIPLLYNTDPAVKTLSTQLLIAYSVYMPVNAYLNATYFTMRSGGRTVITFLFDSAYVWVVTVPLAYCLVHFTGLDILAVIVICLSADALKVTVGTILLKKKIWIKNLVDSTPAV